MASGNGKASIPSRKQKCTFIGCSKSKNRYPDLHFFQFPTSRPLICKEWIASCANNLLIDMPEKKLKSQVVCQEHFTDKSFLNLMKKNLKKDAVPTIRTDINDQNQPRLSTDITHKMASGNGKVNIPSRKQKCTFIGCSKSKNRYPDLHFFQFPTSRPLICKEWIASCENNMLIDMPEKKLKSQVVCQEHFTDKSFLNLMKKNLKKDAVPTIRSNINDQNQPRLSTDSLLSCRFCENPFISEAILKVHECFCVNNRIVEAQKKNPVDIEQMTVIMNGMRSYYCQYCLFKTGGSNIFLMHLKRHDREVKLYFCKICNIDLFNPYDLFNHFQLLHPGQDSYQCRRCSFATTHVSLMRQHWKSHFYHHCGFCTYKTIDLLHLRLHRHKHLNRKFQCLFKECIYSCDTSDALDNHKTEHHKIKSESEEECRFHEPDKNHNTNSSESKTVEASIKEAIVSDCQDSIAESHSHFSHETRDRFSRSVELFDQVNSDISQQVEEDKNGELRQPLISNNEISSTVVASLDAHTTETVISTKEVTTSELLTNDINENASSSTSQDSSAFETNPITDTTHKMTSVNVNSRKHKCSFIGCSKSKYGNPDLHFFQFPTRRPSICQEWIASCANDQLIDKPETKLKHRVVCQEHFTINSFSNEKRKRLNRNAVPTIYKAKNSNDQNQRRPVFNR